MFELGARPHPPRELYRAYLAQSDVFVGVYWQQYGWIAPGEEISGLEDEYRLAPREMPKLIYVKQPAERDERLDALIARIRDDDTASYTPFSTADELADLIEADLATLLAERFDASRASNASGADDVPIAEALPMPSTGVVGRDAEVATLLAWLGEDDGRRLVTLVGAGGIGKTRLALEVARLARDAFDRVTFVALEHVREDRDVLPAIARGFGVRDLGDRPLIDRLTIARAGRRDLIVLDNFEQVASSAPLVATLLTALPDAKVLVTSRSRLRLREEHVFDVDPLDLPSDPAGAASAEIMAAPAVRLFRDRARAVDPRFELTEDNAADVARICRALDGVPLAIELAAIRIRVLTPSAMLERLDHVLPPRTPSTAATTSSRPSCSRTRVGRGSPWAIRTPRSSSGRSSSRCRWASRMASGTGSRGWARARPCSATSIVPGCSSVRRRRREPAPAWPTSGRGSPTCPTCS